MADEIMDVNIVKHEWSSVLMSLSGRQATAYVLINLVLKPYHLILISVHSTRGKYIV